MRGAGVEWWGGVAAGEERRAEELSEGQTEIVVASLTFGGSLEDFRSYCTSQDWAKIVSWFDLPIFSCLSESAWEDTPWLQGSSLSSEHPKHLDLGRPNSQLPTHHPQGRAVQSPPGRRSLPSWLRPERRRCSTRGHRRQTCGVSRSDVWSWFRAGPMFGSVLSPYGNPGHEQQLPI